jgi:PAS domain S-box-containing protein
VTDSRDRLLGFYRRAANHSALRGDGLAELLGAARDDLVAGTGASTVSCVPAETDGEDVLLRHEVALDDALAAAAISVAGPDGADMLLPVRGVSGELFALRVDGADPGTLGFAGALVEVLTTALHRHWQEVQHQQRADALREAQRHTQVGCFEWDIITNKVRWSDELFRIYGCEPQSFEPTFEEFLERIHPDDRDAIRTSVYQAYEERRDYRIEERILRPDGATRLLSSWGHMITNEHSEPVKIVGSCQDVTDMRRTMEDLAATERRLAEVDARQVQGLEINDNVVQGLAAAAYALELGLADQASAAVQATLAAARTMVEDLLATSGEMEVGRLVRERPAAPVLGDGPRPAAVAGRGPLRVVLADDSADIRLLVALTLAEDGGFEVVGEAADGVEAVAIATIQRPDVLLLDLAMPELDGLSVIPRVRAESPGTCIVVLSGFDSKAAAGPALELGAAAFIEKGRIGRSLGDSIRAVITSREPYPVS